MRLMWIGGPTTRLEIGAFRVLTDPMLGEGAEAFVMRRHPTTGALNVPIPGSRRCRASISTTSTWCLPATCTATTSTPARSSASTTAFRLSHRRPTSLNSAIGVSTM